MIFIGGALSTFFENQPFLSDYWWCKIYFYTLNSRIIGGAAAPGALQVWRHWLVGFMQNPYEESSRLESIAVLVHGIFDIY